MGWICSYESDATLKRVDAVCRAQSKEITGKEYGMSNVYTHPNGAQYIIEVSRRDQPDNGIAGTIMKVCEGSAYADSCKCMKAGTFRIAGDGSFVRAPAWMKALALK